ncbi:hypothetical protein GGI15_001440 [Coemansia interrupta]|uniref:Uncharacterized protein n=1 Tax=Coemansia interrupta TaxID=1126814 RepID=A0A9W8LMJ5_9FUNG|nr:hypothetical protein GGI15_001440 [Coemansia interrupta]
MWGEDSRYDAAEERNGQANMGYDSFDELGDSRMDSVDRAAPHTYGGIRQMEQTSATSAREHSASTGMNPYAMLHHINRELMEAGLPSPLLLVEQPECLEDNQRIVECLVALLEQHKRDAGVREGLGDELRRAMGEEDQLRSALARSQRELDASQRDAAVTRIRWQEAERLHGETEMQRKQTAQELRATRATMAQARAQFQHEAKKRDGEAGKLRERMQKLITDKYRSAKISFELVNPALKGLQPVDKGGRELAAFRRMAEDYEANQGKLVERVSLLEDLLRGVREALAALRAEFGEPGESDESAEAPAEEGAGDEMSAVDGGRAMALVAAVRRALYRERAEQHQQRATEPSVDAGELEQRDTLIASQKDEITRLRSEVSDLSNVLAEQKRMLDAAMEQDTAGRRMSMDSLSGEQIEYERAELRREQAQLAGERQKFTEAAIELGNERAELKRRVEAFEREREEFYRGKPGGSTEALVAGLPETPQWMRGMDAAALATPAMMRSMQAAETPTQQMLASMFMQGAGAITGTLRPQSRSSGASSLTPVRPVGVRTPVDVRSGRQPRTCTRPGCAAHAHHEHEDGSGAPRMELKPPVPRFGRARRSEQEDRPAVGSRHNPIGRPAPRTNAADIFK